MSFLNYAAREITCKIVYAGPGIGGKTTNVQQLWQRTNPALRGRLVSLATDSERTLFFDFLPIELGMVRGFRVRMQLYSVPGQVFYAASRRLVLRGTDGLVFVADSQRERIDANVESLEDVAGHLADHGLPLGAIPWVAQYNKRDLPSAMPIEELRAILNPNDAPEIEAIASKGVGVVESLRAVGKLVLRNLAREDIRSVMAR